MTPIEIVDNCQKATLELMGEVEEYIKSESTLSKTDSLLYSIVGLLASQHTLVGIIATEILGKDKEPSSKDEKPHL